MKKLLSLTAIAGLGLISGTTGLLAQATWNGADGADWNVSGNWLGTAPVNSGTSALVFSATSTNLTSTNSLTSLTVSSLTFASGAKDNTLNGNAITLSGDVTVSTGNWQAINTDIGLTGNRKFTVSSGQLTLGGALTDGTSAGGILKEGGAKLILKGAGSMTGVSTQTVAGGNPGAGSYTVPLVFNTSGAGTVVIQNTAALGAASLKGIQFNSGGGGTLDLQTDTSVNGYGIFAGSGGTANTIIANRLTSVADANITHNLGVAQLGSSILTINKGGNVTGAGIAKVTFSAVSLTAGNNDRVVTFNGSAAISLGDVATTANAGNNRRLGLAGTNANNAVTGVISNLAAGVTGTSLLSLIKSDSSTWTLTGANTYTGITTIAGGTLQLGNGGATGTLNPASAIQNGGTLAFNRTGTITQGTDFAGTISAYATDYSTNAAGVALGTPVLGKLVKSGSGNLILNGSNTLNATDSLTFSGNGSGTVTLKNAAALGAAGNTVRFSGGGSGILDIQSDTLNACNFGSGTGNGGTITLTGTDGATTAGYALGTLDLSSVTMTLNRGGAVTSGTASFTELKMTGGNDFNPVTLAGDATWIVGSASITANGLSKRLQLDGSSAGNVIAGAISDTNNATAGAKVNLIKANTSTWTLNGTNTYTGTTAVNGGTLKAGSTQAFGSNSAVTMANTSGAILDLNNYSNSIGSLTGGGTNGGVVSLGSTTLTVGGNNTSPAAFAGSITGSGGVLVKTGTGTLTLSGSNSYTGGTVINGGAVAINSDSSLGTSSGGVTLAGGTLSVIANVNAFSHNIDTGTTGGAINVTSGRGLQFNDYNANSATIIGSGPLTVEGGGQLTLSATATSASYSGNWTVNAGRVEVQVSGALGSGSVTLASGAELVNSWGNTIGNSIVSDGGILSYDNGGVGVFSGPVSLNSGTTTVSLKDFYGPTARNGSITGLMSGTGALSVSGNGTSGMLTLSGTNTYSGGTTINSGATVRLNSGNSGNGVIRGTVNINSEGTLLSTVHDSFGYAEGSQIKTLNIDGGTVTHSSNDALTLASAAVIMTGGTMQTTGGSSSAFDFFNNGSGNTGVTTLASGTTATIAGKISLRNGIGATTTFDVADGAAPTDLLVSAVIADGAAQGTGSCITKTGDGFMLLSGSNTYTGLTTVSAGTLAFDLSETLPGGLTVATSGTAVLTAHDGGAGNVKVLDISSLTISGTTLFVGGGDKAGNNIAAGLASPEPVPEPGTWAMLLGGLGVLGAWRKARRRRG